MRQTVFGCEITLPQKQVRERVTKQEGFSESQPDSFLALRLCPAPSPTTVNANDLPCPQTTDCCLESIASADCKGLGLLITSSRRIACRLPASRGHLSLTPQALESDLL